MKKFFACLVISITFLSIPVQEASAYIHNGWQANAHISVTQFRATATVVNNSHRPIMCSGYVYGRTYYGNTMNAWMNRQVIYPRQHANVYVYTNYSQPFVNAWADIRCRYL